MISMYLAGHFRSIARKALRGFWTLTIGVTLLAALLGSGVVRIRQCLRRAHNPQLSGSRRILQRLY